MNDKPITLQLTLLCFSACFPLFVHDFRASVTLFMCPADTCFISGPNFLRLNAGKNQLVSFDRSKTIGAIDVKMDTSVLEEKL